MTRLVVRRTGHAPVGQLDGRILTQWDDNAPGQDDQLLRTLPQRDFAGPLGMQEANVVAWVAIAVADTSANQLLTFGVSGRACAARAQAEGLLVFGTGIDRHQRLPARTRGCGRETGRRGAARRAGRRERCGGTAALHVAPILGLPATTDLLTRKGISLKERALVRHRLPTQRLDRYRPCADRWVPCRSTTRRRQVGPQLRIVPELLAPQSPGV